MNVAVRASVVLAVAVCLVTILIAVTGLHKNAVVGGFGALLLFIVINIGVVYWALARTAATNAYLQQLGNAALIGLIGGVLIAASSFILLSYVFPSYLEEARQAALDLMERMGAPEQQIEAQAAAMERMTPVSQAIQGAIGTFGTSLVVGAIIAVFKRRK